MPAKTLQSAQPFNPAGDVLQAMKDHIAALVATLPDYCVSLQANERRTLTKLGAKTVDFVDKGYGHLVAHPEFKPGYVDMGRLGENMAAVEILRDLGRSLDQLASLVEDTRMLAGSEALEDILAFYTAVRGAAKAGKPNAEAIYRDLSPRFPGRPTKAAVATREAIRQAKSDGTPTHAADEQDQLA